ASVGSEVLRVVGVAVGSVVTSDEPSPHAASSSAGSRATGRAKRSARALVRAPPLPMGDKGSSRAVASTLRRPRLVPAVRAVELVRPSGTAFLVGSLRRLQHAPPEREPREERARRTQ